MTIDLFDPLADPAESSDHEFRVAGLTVQLIVEDRIVTGWTPQETREVADRLLVMADKAERG